MGSLTAGRPFYVAHRGGGGNWPEMTSYAYEQAAKIPGLHALEISVCRTADGVLVCSHDPTTTRLTGQPYVIAEQPWETLSSLLVSPEETSDRSQPPRPFTRFDDVVERYIGTHVLFVEPKVPGASTLLLDRMAQLAQPERVVWKQPVNSRLFVEAKRRGFTTWGYVLDEAAHLGDNLARFAASSDLDMLGAQRKDTGIADAVLAAAGANGKPAIVWPVYTPEQRAEAEAQGFRGLMTANVAGLLSG